jgi:hypothetical protein
LYEGEVCIGDDAEHNPEAFEASPRWRSRDLFGRPFRTLAIIGHERRTLPWATFGRPRWGYWRTSDISNDIGHRTSDIRHRITKRFPSPTGSSSATSRWRLRSDLSNTV